VTLRCAGDFNELARGKSDDPFMKLAFKWRVRSLIRVRESD
jgi:hypothetical protein